MANADISSTSGALPERIKKSISEQYTEQAEELLKQARVLLSWPEIIFKPNFEQNYTILSTAKIDLRERGYRRIEQHLEADWEDKFGADTLGYFEGMVQALKWNKFDKDDMLQEAIKESVDQAVIELKVVEKPQSEATCDCVLLDGKLVIQTRPASWAVDSSMCGDKVVYLL